MLDQNINITYEKVDMHVNPIFQGICGDAHECIAIAVRVLCGMNDSNNDA